MLLAQICFDQLKFQVQEHAHQEVCSIIFDFIPEPYEKPSTVIPVSDVELLSKLLGVAVEIKTVTDPCLRGCYEDLPVVDRADAIKALQNVDQTYGDIIKQLEALDWKVKPVENLAENLI